MIEQVSLVKMCCGECNVLFWLSDAHYEVLRREHNTFYCPNGHARVFAGKTDAQIAGELKMQIQSCEGTIRSLQDEIKHLKHSNDGYKGRIEQFTNKGKKEGD